MIMIICCGLVIVGCTMDSMTDFSGSASDMLSMMKAAGISEDAAEQAALDVASAPPSQEVGFVMGMFIADMFDCSIFLK
jgi:hypothetical protein